MAPLGGNLLHASGEAPVVLAEVGGVVVVVVVVVGGIFGTVGIITSITCDSYCYNLHA